MICIQQKKALIERKRMQLYVKFLIGVFNTLTLPSKSHIFTPVTTTQNGWRDQVVQQKGKKMLAMLTLIPLVTGMVMGAFPAAITYAAAGDNTSQQHSCRLMANGDLHVHTFESDDAQNSLENVLDAGLTQYGLDWIALTDHLRLSKRDHNGNEIPGGSIPMSVGMNEYQVPQIKALQEQGKYAGKTIFSGFEWDMPTHEHVGVGILTDEPNSTEALEAAKEFEYRFTNRDASLFDPADVAAWEQEGGRAFTTHQDALTAIEWLKPTIQQRAMR